MILQPKQEFCTQKVLYLRGPNNNNFITKFRKTLLDFFATTRSYCDGGIVASHDVAE